jgi:hypothetical protein
MSADSWFHLIITVVSLVAGWHGHKHLGGNGNK